MTLFLSSHSSSVKGTEREDPASDRLTAPSQVVLWRAETFGRVGSDELADCLWEP